MTRLAAALVSIVAFGAALFAAQGNATKSLEIYVIDAAATVALANSANA